MSTQNAPAENQMTVATQPANAVKPIDRVRHDLEKMKDQMKMVLPAHITPERMFRVALTCISQTPKLLECDKTSLYGAIMRAAQLGLEPDGILGQAYLIPFKRNFKDGNIWKHVMEVQFIPGYKGLIDLARRSGEVSNIIAKEVCANDEFSIDFSQEVPFVHKPLLKGDRGEVTHFWAMARFKDGGFHWDYLTREEVEKIRDNSAGYKAALKLKTEKDTVWSNHFIEMGKKTAIRRIAKYLPMSVQKATATEDLREAGRAFKFDSLGDIELMPAYDENPQLENHSEEGDETPKTGNAGVKDKLAKRAKEAGADPETGELPPEKEEPQTEQQKGEFSAKQIGLRFKPDNSPDYDAWFTQWAEMCNAAQNLEELLVLHSNNVKIINQIQQKSQPHFDKASVVFNDVKLRLGDAETKEEKK